VVVKWVGDAARRLEFSKACPNKYDVFLEYTLMERSTVGLSQ